MSGLGVAFAIVPPAQIINGWMGLRSLHRTWFSAAIRSLLHFKLRF